MIPDSNAGRCMKDDRQIKNDENLNDLPVIFKFPFSDPEDCPEISWERQQILDLLRLTHEIGGGQNSELSKIRSGLTSLTEQLREQGEERNRERKELHDISMELAVGLFEVFDALKKISSGYPEVRIPEISEVEIIAKLKYMVNRTAIKCGEMIDNCHEFAMVLTEHFDVLQRVSRGELNARVSGESKVELLEAFKKVTNRMIESTHKANIERELTEDLLKESEKRYRDVSELLPQIVFETDATGNVIFVNRKAFHIFGYTQADVKQGLNMLEMFIPEERERALENFQRRLRGEEIGGMEYIAARKDGGIFPVAVFAIRILRENEIMGLRGILIDITERKRTEKELARLATTDHLTGLYNRIKYDEIVEKEIERFKRYGKPLSMMMFDIDDFKKINDIYGHCAGDSVLKTAANIVGGNIRKLDYLVRWGGDEFIILCPETSVDVASALAERIRIKVESHEFSIVGKITISLGVTEFREDDTGDNFIKEADAALYEAKGKGRNRVEVAV